MMGYTFYQFSNNLINKDIDSLVANYYESIYNNKKLDGYLKPDDFFEIPVWIAEISAIIKSDKKDCNLYIITNIEEAIEHIFRSSNVILFSLLDVTKDLVEYILIKVHKTCLLYKTRYPIVITGGYAKLSNPLLSTHYESVAEFTSNCFGIVDYKPRYDYSLFKGLNTIPRLQLSTGCLYNCNFCTISKSLKLIDNEIISNNIESFKDLTFKLVYIDDKTFGQAKNWNLLTPIYSQIKKFNSDFRGFIIQTSANMITDSYVQQLKSLQVFAVELGLESYNNGILRDMNKNHISCKIISEAVDKLYNAGIKVILNVIIGYPGETNITYYNTLKYLEDNKEKIYFLNIYNLAIYSNTSLARIYNVKSKDDENELNTNKSFLSIEQNRLASDFSSKLYQLGFEILNKDNKQKIEDMENSKPKNERKKLLIYAIVKNVVEQYTQPSPHNNINCKRHPDIIRDGVNSELLIEELSSKISDSIL